MGMGYHHVCGVVSPDSDGLVEMVIVSDVVTFNNGQEAKKGGSLAGLAGPSWQ